MIHESVLLTCDHKDEKGNPACAQFWPHAIKILNPDGTPGVALLGITQRDVDAGKIFSIKVHADGAPSSTFCAAHKPVEPKAAAPAPAQATNATRATRPATTAQRQPPAPAQPQERPRFGSRLNKLRR